jgi:hypothetical protein
MTKDAVSMLALTRPFVGTVTAVLSHATHDVQPEESARATRMYSRASSPLVTRSRLDIAAMFGGVELVKPGLVRTSRWLPPEQVPVTEVPDLHAGVGRKPTGEMASGRSLGS